VNEGGQYAWGRALLSRIQRVINLVAGVAVCNARGINVFCNDSVCGMCAMAYVWGQLNSRR
jgi:hypothetical protein